ncbi:MAG: Regulator of RpoS [bacterium]|nr:Regulator of RpoS [bacterium]
MDNPTILVADGDPKNLQILRESLEASGFEVIVASDGLQAWQKISSDVPDLILSEVNLPKLDGFQLLEKLKADPVTSSIPLMFLTNRRELQDRVRSLRGGVKDYMIKPLHVKEVIARVRMILRRMERIREEEIESTRKLAGRLEEFSVIDLIENFGMERKTGILTLYNANNKSGEIYFRDGAVINSSLGNLKAEKAVYQMLPWKRGHFTMTFKEINVPDEIAVSNLGLLLQGFKRMEERERLFKMLPSPETTFMTTETFRNIIIKRELTTDVAKFISLIDGKRDILQVIDESNYDDIKTLERLVKLYQQGFIKPAKSTFAGDDEMSDMVSTIAEPKIIEKLDLGQNVESRFTGRPTEKEMSPQALRRPDIPTAVPIERKPKEARTITIETKHDEAPAAPPATKLPPPVRTSEPPPPKVIMPAALQDDFEAFGEDAQPEEPPKKIEKPLEAIAAALQIRNERQEVTPPKEATPKPESLPIDLNDLMQRPTAAPPILDKPVVPRLPAPPVAEPPTVEAKTEAGETLPPVFKTRNDKPAAPASIVEILDEAVPTATGGASTRPPEIAKKFGSQLTETTPEPAAEPKESAKPEAPPLSLVEPAALPETKTKTIEVDSPEAMEAVLASLQMQNELVTTPPTMITPPPASEISAPVQKPSAPITPAPELPPPSALPVFEPVEMRSEPVTPVPPVQKSVPPVPMPGAPVAPPMPVVPQSIEPVPTPVAPMAPQVVTPLPVTPISSETVAPLQPVDSITACLSQLLKSRPAAKPKLVIIGREGLLVSPMVRSLLGAESSLRRLQSAVFQYFEIGERKVESQPFEIIGISMEQQFTRLLDTAGEDLIGYVVIIEAHRKERLEYLSYLLNMLKNVYRRPLGIAIIKSADQKNMSADTLRDLLNIVPADFLQECTPTDKLSVLEFLKGFTSEANLQRWSAQNTAGVQKQ